MYSDLSSKQIMILEFIKKQSSLRGYPPSVRELCEAVGLRSTSTVHSHLNKLEKLGYIRRDPTKPRAIEVLDTQSNSDVSANPQFVNLPLIGEITAGQPILAQENIEDYLPLPSNLIKGSDNFVLKVKGDSMIDAGILNGDYVIISKKNVASNGQIVAALIQNEYATVKRFFREDNDLVRLQPENEFLEPIILSSCDVEIIGVITGVFRVM